GYPEALARVACLLARKGEPLMLSRLEAKQEIMVEYKDLLPAMPPDQWRRVRGEQEIIVRYEPEEALATLPRLLAKKEDREKLVTLVQQVLADGRVQPPKPSPAPLAMVDPIGDALAVGARRKGTVRTRNRKPARKRASAGKK